MGRWGTFIQPQSAAAPPEATNSHFIVLLLMKLYLHQLHSRHVNNGSICSGFGLYYYQVIWPERNGLIYINEHLFKQVFSSLTGYGWEEQPRKREMLLKQQRKRRRVLVMGSFIFPLSFSGQQMIVKSQLVCLEKDKVCWKSYKYQLLLITLGHNDTIPHVSLTHTHIHFQSHFHYCRGHFINLNFLKMYPNSNQSHNLHKPIVTTTLTPKPNLYHPIFTRKLKIIVFGDVLPSNVILFPPYNSVKTLISLWRDPTKCVHTKKLCHCTILSCRSHKSKHLNWSLQK